MANNNATANLAEVIEGFAPNDNPSITFNELLRYVKGPDFSYGCMLGNGWSQRVLHRGRVFEGTWKSLPEELKGGRNNHYHGIPYNGTGVAVGAAD